MDIKTKHEKSELFTFKLLNFVNHCLEEDSISEGEIIATGLLNVLAATAMTGIDCGINKDDLISAMIGDFKDILEKEYVARMKSRHCDCE